MITGLSGRYDNSYEAIKDAVWLHGHLADEAIKKHSKEEWVASKEGQERCPDVLATGTPASV